MKKKLKSNAGETLIETLCAVVVFTLSMLMLSQAIVTAAKVNAKAEDASKPLRIIMDGVAAPTETTVPVSITKDGTTLTSVDVTMYTTADEYRYYTPVS